MLFKEIKKYNSFVLKLLVLLLVLYAFTVSFGTVFKPEGEISPQPMVNLSFLTYVIWLLVFIAGLQSNHLKSNSVINYLLLLSLYLFFNTLFFADDIFANLVTWVGFLANILLVYFVSNIKLKKSFLLLLFYALSWGILISSTITLMDQFNIINVPFFNETSSRVTGTESELRGFSGPFQSRTTMGAFYSISLVISLLSFLYYKRLFFLVAFIIAFLAMILSFNRGAPFALIIVALLYFIRKYKINFKKITYAIIIGVVFIFVIFNTLSDEQRDSMKYLVLSSLNIIEKHDRLADSDNVRTDALKQILTVEIVKNPLGQGFNDFYLQGSLEPISVHSNINYIFYIAGIFGVFWLFFFLRRLYITTHAIRDNELDIIKYSLFSWALYSLTHMVINTFLAWLLLGLLLNRHLIYKDATSYKNT